MTNNEATRKSAEIIDEDFWYSSPERKHLLLGKTRYSEVDAAYAAMSDDERAAFSSEIPVMSSIRWSGRFLEFKVYLAATGGVYPNKNNSRSLCDWVQRNRRMLRAGKLAEDRKVLLDGLDPSWHLVRERVPDGKGTRLLRRKTPDEWKQRLNEYVSFVAANGRVPSQYSESLEEKALNRWITNQKSFMHNRWDAAERIALINEAIPGFFDEKRKRMDWDEALEMFTTFISNHGRFPSAETGSPDEIFIGRWIRTQRETRTAKRDSRHAERTAKLDAVFPAWRDKDFFSDQKWGEKLERLAIHVEVTGRMPTSGIEHEKELALWRMHQKIKLKHNVIKPERLRLLNERVPGWSDKVQRSELKAIRDSEPTVND